MRSGNPVVYVDARGRTHAAHVIAVVGTGASTYKRLWLSVDGYPRTNVPHEKDAGAGHYWTNEYTAPAEMEIPAPAEFAAGDE